MALVALPVDQMSPAGVDVVDNAGLSLANTYQIPNDGKTFLHVKNTGGTACVVTINTPGTVDGLAIADLTVTVPITTGDRMIGPFRPEVYNDANGLLNVTFSFITGVTIAAVRMPS